MVVSFKSTAMPYSRCSIDTETVLAMAQQQVDNQTTLAHAGDPP